MEHLVWSGGLENLTNIGYAIHRPRSLLKLSIASLTDKEMLSAGMGWGGLESLFRLSSYGPDRFPYHGTEFTFRIWVPANWLRKWKAFTSVLCGFPASWQVSVARSKRLYISLTADLIALRINMTNSRSANSVIDFKRGSTRFDGGGPCGGPTAGVSPTFPPST